MHYIIQVLKATKNKAPEENGIESKNNLQESVSNANKQNSINDTSHVNKKQRILEKITYDDLEDATKNTMVPLLNLSKVERYLHGPIPGSDIEYLNTNEVAVITRNILQDIRQQWSTRQPSSTLVSPAAAVGALGELSPGGALMRGFQEQSLARKQLLHFHSKLILPCISCNQLIGVTFTSYYLNALKMIEKEIEWFASIIKSSLPPKL